MPPDKNDRRRWTTPVQRSWLLASIPDYLEAQSKGRYDKFWPQFFEEWFKAFPAREPGPQDLTDTEPDIDPVPDVPSESEAGEPPLPASSKKRKKTKKKPAQRKKVSYYCPA